MHNFGHNGSCDVTYSCDVFVLIFMRDGQIFRKQKIGAANKKTYKVKERKRNTKKVKKKNNHLLYYFIVLSRKYFFYCNYISR